MERVTFVKYNSLRKPEYRITTEIHENEHEKWAIKRPGHHAAKAHLRQIAANRSLLKERLYRDVSVLDVTTEKDDRLRFPFVTGRTLAEDIQFSKEDPEAFVNQFNQALDRILDVREECKCAFTATETFINCFGNTYPEDGVPAVCPANLDSVLTNFVETKDGLVCLDYEWAYDFPIPIDYIKYRSIRYFYNERMNSMFDGIARDTVMEWFGFDQEKQDTFWNMESHFQQQIYGKDWQYLYPNRYKKGEVTLQALNDKIAEQNELSQEQDRIIKYNEYLIQEKDETIKNNESQIQERDNIIKYNENMIQNLEKEITGLKQEYETQRQAWDNTYQEMIHSTSWRITKPLRGISLLIRRIFKK